MEDKARRAMLDAAKLADELRVEQENAQGLERDRKDLENRAHELQINLDEAEANAIKWGRKMVAKLESRAKDIEGKLLMNLSETRNCNKGISGTRFLPR